MARKSGDVREAVISNQKVYFGNINIIIKKMSKIIFKKKNIRMFPKGGGGGGSE